MSEDQKENGENSANLLRDRYLDAWVLLDQTRYIMFSARELELNQFGITPEQAGVFRMLINNPKGVAPAEMPSILLREPHSVYGLLGRMEKREPVKRVKSPPDDKTRVVLTAKGKQLYKKSIDRTSLHMILSVLSEEEIGQLDVLLGKLKDRARSVMGIDHKLPFLK